MYGTARFISHAVFEDDIVPINYHGKVEFKLITSEALPICSSLHDGLSSKEDVFIPMPEEEVLSARPREIFCEGAKIREDNRMGAARPMMPCYWVDEPWRGDGVGVSILHAATIFGGTFSGRNNRTHRRGQCLILADGKLIDDSFGAMDGSRTYAEDILVEVGPDQYRYIGPSVSEYYPGDYFFLGSAHHHFGHFMLEGLSRVWAYRMIASALPGIKLVIYEPSVPSFILELLSMAGISREQIVFSSGAMVCERLIVPKMAMRTHHWITSFQRRAWESVAPLKKGGGKVFLSRRGVANRPLGNEESIEKAFRKAGFEIVCSEKLPITEQIEMATSVDCFAGAVGSQMYLSAFMKPGGKVLVMAPENFYLKDDFLISAALNLKLKVQLGGAIDFSRQKSARQWDISEHAVSRLIEEAGLAEGGK